MGMLLDESLSVSVMDLQSGGKSQGWLMVERKAHLNLDFSMGLLMGLKSQGC